MPNWIKRFVKYVDAVNRLVGRGVLYLVFVMMGILLYSAISRYCFDAPVIWGVEMAQFTMVAYLHPWRRFCPAYQFARAHGCVLWPLEVEKAGKDGRDHVCFSGRVPCVAVLWLCFKHVVLHRV